MTVRETGALPPERRRDLLATAAEEFAAAGYERASLNRVIKARGMSKSSFYHYFDSKEALFDAVVADLGTGAAAALGTPDPEAFADEGFWDGLAALAGRLAADEDLRLLGRLFYLPDAPTGGALAATRAAVEDWIYRALKAGRAAGAVGDDLPVALQRHLLKAVLWAMDEWSIAHAESMSEDEQRALATAQLEALRRLLAG
ncbi:TetR/AcrR family transcriptional regulator [Glycomyces paridis]|uniref:TetR/AcrR family transcriptional regulator n=1 Tax=Glycomyces paridis TaxID=2126555 RepID=A0A4S8PA17_9ACTN|nr:TetR/AcrR family transcriptional regulator [Glycomyces paridis]THV26541.1 TetR/AcrR family transcriptional regulator [Glycomyces paridis]